MTDLLLIRHAHPMTGEVDPRLSPVGRRQAERLGRWLAAEQVDAIVASPMARARETADVAAREMKRPVTAILEDLREWDLDHEADGRYVALEDLGDGNVRFEALRTGNYEDFIPDIDRNEFLFRVRLVMNEIIERWPHQRVAVFSHGGLINAALSTALGLEDKLFFFVPDYTSVSVVRVMPGGRRVVHALNSAGHLVGQRDEDQPETMSGQKSSRRRSPPLKDGGEGTLEPSRPLERPFDYEPGLVSSRLINPSTAEA